MKRQPAGPRPTGAAGGGSRTAATLAAAVAVSTAGMLPATLVGALAVRMRTDLRFDKAGLGIAVGTFFLLSAVSSTTAGRWNDRVGVRTALLVSAGSSALCLAAIAVAARSYLLLIVCLAAGAPAAALSTPATNTLVAVNLPSSHHGRAHGAKQAAIPLAGLLAGLALPTVAVTIGWRWAFAMAVAVPVVGAATGLAGAPARMAAEPVEGRRRARGKVDRLEPLIWLVAAGACGAAAVTSLNSFAVVAAVDAGVRQSAAGIVFAGASALVIAVRLVVGYAADRRPGDRIGMMAAMLVLSTAGYGLLATQRPVPVAVGVVVGLAAGWGWPGLLTLAVVELHPEQPGVATGYVMTGIYAGAVVGPLAVALLSDRWSFAAGWLGGGVLALAAAGCFLVGRSRYRAGAERPSGVGALA